MDKLLLVRSGSYGLNFFDETGVELVFAQIANYVDSRASVEEMRKIELSVDGQDRIHKYKLLYLSLFYRNPTKLTDDQLAERKRRCEPKGKVSLQIEKIAIMVLEKEGWTHTELVKRIQQEIPMSRITAITRIKDLVANKALWHDRRRMLYVTKETHSDVVQEVQKDDVQDGSPVSDVGVN